MADDQETPLHRYIGMVKDMQSYLDYTIEMEKLAMHMNEHGKQTRAYASLSFQYDTYRVARETYWEKCMQTYGVADVETLAREMHALEPELGKSPTLPAKGMEHHKADQSEIRDQQLKTWLSERIVRLELYRYELDSIREQIDARDHHADYQAHQGQPSPPQEQQQRETLSRAYLRKVEEIRAAFEPTASHPFSPDEEMKLYCQTLTEVNERLKQQETHYHPPQRRSLRDLFTSEQEEEQQPGDPRDEPERGR